MSWRSNTRSALAFTGIISSLTYPSVWSQPFTDTPNTVITANTISDKTLKELRRKASSGHLREELELAGDYYEGRGISRNLEQAAYWYKKAADQGDPGAQVQIGYFYLVGLGVKQDQGHALRWLERASASGSQMGKLNLAVLYLRGIGVPRDTRLGLNLLNDLAKANEPHAEAYLGVVYMLGIGVDKDVAQAEFWFSRAAKHHSAEGNYCMGTLYSVTDDHPHDPQKAAAYLRESSDAGYVRAKHSLGLLLVNHPELAQQSGEPVQLLEAAAAGGSWRSSVVLGVLYRDGKDVPKDPGMSYRWFTIAQNQGGKEAEAMVRNDMAFARAALSADQQKQSEQAAADWMNTYPHNAVFVFSAASGSAIFPIDQVYSIELAQAESSKGANVR